MTTITLTPRAEREQKTFRALLNAMARPGSVGRLPQTDFGVWYASLLCIAEALVDHEVTFATSMHNSAELSDAILRQTGSREASPAEADYVFCDTGSLLQALSEAKDGPFEYPDENGTVVCLVQGIAGEPGRGTGLILSGPGIQDWLRVWVEGIPSDFAAAFEQRNSEPPMGLDLVLVAPDGSFTCLTRYTTLTQEVD
ncbi:MAG TPA: phosphonate C-P lyase system protein PhnH [Dehalococcoidia bacterium]|nr:phosphonate C-P lyase system protein PhnH [Dehalococcoidia bacterium]